MSTTMKLPELFGSMVFNEDTMKERPSSASCKAWKQCVTDRTSLDLSTANEIADSMKQWAVEKGATHFTHWFQPMTGVTAEKHDSFILPTGGGKIMLEFSVKELVMEVMKKVSDRHGLGVSAPRKALRRHQRLRQAHAGNRRGRTTRHFPGQHRPEPHLPHGFHRKQV